MLEGVAASLLSRYLGKYIDGLQRENLNVSLGSGDLVLENLKLKKEALDDLELPIEVCGGTLGKLRLKIPWKRLKSEPAVISLENLFILVRPRSSNESDDEARKLQELKIKRRNLRLAELMNSSSSSDTTAADPPSNSGYFSSYTSLIVNNLQVYIDKVHIRYEDAISSPSNSFVMGITLEQIHAETTNEEWESSFLSSQDNFIVHKLVSLKNLSIYWESNTKPSSFPNNKKMSSQMANWVFSILSPPSPPYSFQIPTESNYVNHNYLLKPISAELKLVMNRDPIPDMEIPKMTLNFVFDQISLSLSSSQYRDMLDTMEYFQRCSKYGKYNHLRPTANISEAPLAHWSFILKSKKEESVQERRRWKWSEMQKMKEKRLEYIELYCSKKRNKKKGLCVEDMERLEGLEDELEYETILLFRSLALKYLEKDLAFAAQKKEEEQASSSWFGRVWNYTSGGEDLSLQLTDDIMKEIYQEIHDQEDKPFAVDIPKDYVKMRLNFELETGSFELHSGDIIQSKFASACFSGYHISLEKRPDSISFTGDLESIEVMDFFTKNTKYPQLITPSPVGKEAGEEDEEDPYFFTMMLDINPLDTIADYRLLVSMRPLNIILSKSFINKVIGFFNKPITRIRRRKMNEFNIRAYTKLQEIRQQTEEQLIQAMAERKIFDVQVHLSAPNLMIPKNFEDSKSSTLLLVLGTLSICSDLRGKKKRRKVGDLEIVEEYDASNQLELMEDVETLVHMAQSSHFKEEVGGQGKDFDYLYDKFYVSLTSLEAGITNRSHSERYAVHPDENLIEQFDVNLYVEVCNIDSFDLPKVRISGTLPSLRLNISPEKTSNIMHILNTLNKNSGRVVEKVALEVVEDFALPDADEPIPVSCKHEESSGEEHISLAEKAQKKQIQINFAIPEAAVCFSQNTQDIALIWLHGLSASYLKRPYDVQVTMALHGLKVEDKLQPWGEAFNLLATSEKASMVQSQSVSDLISVTYEGVAKNSPYYEKIDHSVHFNFNKVHVILNRETIITLANCVKNIQQSLKKDSLGGQEQKEGATESVEVEKEEEKSLQEDAEGVEERKIVQLLVKAQFNDISLTMNDTGIKIGIIQLTGSTFGFQLRKQSVFVEGTLGSMRIRDLDPGSQRYPDMFDCEKEVDMVTFSYETFKETEPNFPGYGVLLKITINSVRYMWIERFQLRVRNYFSEISAMQTLLSNTASSAAAVIKQKRLFCYQIQLNNPHIVIPRHVNTDTCLVIDLGKIEIKKQFSCTPDAPHITMTRICVDVKAMNWKTGLLDHEEDHIAVLDDTDLQLWWEKPSEESVQEEHIYPGMNVWVYFPVLHIKLSEHQSWQICGTVEDNICAPPTEHELFVQTLKEDLTSEIECSESKTNLVETLSILNNNQEMEGVEAEEIVKEEEFQFQPDEEKWVDMFIDFHVDKWIIDALKESGKDEEGNSTLVGNLEVLHYDMKYTLYSNGSHLGFFIMHSMKIFDRRHNNPNQFKEILTPLGPGVGKLGLSQTQDTPPNIVGSWADHKNQWECRYVREPNGYQDMSFSWDHCYFIAVPDAIFEIYDVVRPVIFDDITPATNTWRMWKNPNPVLVVPLSHQSQEMQVKMAITSSEVFLLEDPSNINTQSIVLRSTFNIIFKRDNAINARTWCIMVDQFECFKCRLATEDSAIPIMQPLNWCVDYMADDTASNILIDLEPMIFYFSYKDYVTCKSVIDYWLPWLSGRTERIRNKIGYATATDQPTPTPIPPHEEINEKINSLEESEEETYQEEREQEGEEEEEEEEDDELSFQYLEELDPVIKAHLRSDSGISEDSDKLVEGEEEGSSEEEESTKIVLKDLKKRKKRSQSTLLRAQQAEEAASEQMEQNLSVKTGGLKLIIIDDSLANRNSPLANILMENFSVELSSWSTTMKTRVVSQLRVDYYHMQLEVWEPVIEPWFFQFVSSRTPPPEPSSKYQIYASQKCQVNITAAMIETVLNTVEAISSQDDSLPSELRPQLHPYIIRNETGILISYWLSKDDEHLLYDLEPGEERSLQDSSSGRLIQQKRRNLGDIMLPPSVSLIVSGEYTPIKDIPIEKVGTYITRVSPVEKNAFLACNVSFRTGSKVLTVRSNIMVKNQTQLPLYGIAVVDFKDTAILDPIAPGQTFSVPLAFTPNGTLQLRPSEQYRWNDGELLLHKIQRLKRHRTVSCKTLHRNPDSSDFFYHISLTTSHSGKIHHVNVLPPLCIENLLPNILEFRIIHKYNKQTLCNESIGKGECIYIHSVDPAVPLTLSVKIPCFGWSKPEDMNTKVPSEVLRLLDEERRTLSLRMNNVVEASGMRKIIIFAQYWMVNHTGLRLLYRRSGIDSSLAAGQAQREKKDVTLGPHARDWYDEDESLKEPFLFTTSFFNFDPRGDLARIQIANSRWSQNINLNSQGATCAFEIPDAVDEGKTTKSFCLSMTISAGKDRFWRTKIASFYPRFIIINNLDQSFVYHQRNTMSQLCAIHPGENIPFHWADEGSPRQICMRLNGEGWEWSGGFQIEELGTFSLKIRNSHSPKLFYLVRVRIKIDKASTLVIISPENMEFPAYKIENLTNKKMKVQQVYSKNMDFLDAKSEMPYAWDRPMAPHTVLLSFQGHEEKLEVGLDYLKSYGPIRVGRDSMRVTVCAKGPTKMLTVETRNRRSSRSSIGPGWVDLNSDPNPSDEEEVVQTEFQLVMEGIGISVINETPVELSYITVEKIHITHTNSNLYQSLDFKVSWLQIDNQLYETPYPVVIHPLADRENSANIFFDLNICIANQISSIMYIKNFCAVLQHLDLKLDEEFVLHTMKYVDYITTFIEQRKRRLANREKSKSNEGKENMASMLVEEEVEVEVEDAALQEILDEPKRKFVNYKPEKVGSLQSKFIYFEILQIYPVQVNFSFASVPGAVRVQDTTISRILSRGGVLANIDSAPLVLGEIFLEHPFATRSEMVDRISKHYVNSAIREFHKMLGSADFLGSPISFVRTMGTGFYDFFNEPVQSLDSPFAFSMGVARGTQSLIKNTTWGAFNSVAKFSSTLGKGAAELTFDKPYVRERELLSREKPLHALQGLGFGLRDFGISCFQAVGGVVYEPVRGAYDDRLLGMVKGLGRGAIGLGLKPLIGSVDFVTRTAEGIRNTATYWDERSRGRIRPPRYFGREDVLETYCMTKALGQEILFTVSHGKYRNKFYMHHIEEEATIIVISDGQIVSMNRFDTREEDWHVNISEICGIETDKRGVLLHLSDYIASSAFESPTHKRVIFCRSHNRQQVYNTLLYWLQILKHPSFASE